MRTIGASICVARVSYPLCPPVVASYYRGDSCGDTDSYLAIPANQCSESDDGSEDFMFTCDGMLNCS
jgi:hypothetical protein